jgi:hypothetical protein
MVVWVSAAREAASFRKRVVLSDLKSTCSLEVVCAATEQQSNDESEQAEDGREDLNDQDLDETVITLAIFVPVSHMSHSQTHSEGSAASAKAALEPLIPTLTPQIKLHMPTRTPLQNSA